MLQYKKRGLFKKATIFEKPIWLLMDLLVAILVFFLLMYYVNNVGESLTFEREFLSKDIALLIESLYASPGDVSLKYPQNTFWFSYKFEDNAVSVVERGLLEKKAIEWFISDKNLGFEEKTISPEKKFEDKKSFLEKHFSPVSWFSVSRPELPEGTSVSLYFLKDRRRLDISDEELLLRPNKLACSGVETQEDSEEKTLLIDQGDWDKDDRRKDITAAIAYSLYNKVENEFKAIEHTRIGDIWDLADKRIAQTTIKQRADNSDIIIGLYISDYKDERNVIKAYYSSKSDEEVKEKSRKLACLVLNRILSNDNLGDIDGVSIIESDNSLIEKDKIAVLFEIGNINIDEEKNMVLKVGGISEIARSIGEGIEMYYST